MTWPVSCRCRTCVASMPGVPERERVCAEPNPDLRPCATCGAVWSDGKLWHEFDCTHDREHGAHVRRGDGWGW